ncbi:hypothetical protein KC19_2G126600 [Ceratodon purpureus]|uniref:Uncharacterized protein n=1 Tax=Ceratodon purpureus TaxID=3225 RepID=A0A8T0IVC6_CERPU|nr:hypothetical protein KC19_2G126600 [Ceratodon purpureus]
MGDNVALCKELEGTTTQDLEDDQFLERNGLESISLSTAAENSVMNFMKLAFAEAKGALARLEVPVGYVFISSHDQAELHEVQKTRGFECGWFDG